MFRAFQVLAVLLTLFLASPAHAAALSQLRPDSPAAAAFWPSVTLESGRADQETPPPGLETPIGLLCHNDPVNHSDPSGLKLVIHPAVTGYERTLIRNSLHLLYGTQAGKAYLVELIKSDLAFTIHTRRSLGKEEPLNYTGETAPGPKWNGLNTRDNCDIAVPTSAASRMIAEGVYEDAIPPIVWIAHELGHAVSVNRGEQAKHGKAMGPNTPDREYMNDPSEKGNHAEKFENAARDLMHRRHRFY